MCRYAYTIIIAILWIEIRSKNAFAYENTFYQLRLKRNDIWGCHLILARDIKLLTCMEF